MKKLILNSLFFFGLLVILSTNLSAQNLQFNQAIFNTYGPGNADGNLSTPMFTGTLTVGSNQVIKITRAGCSSLNSITSGSPAPIGWGAILINGIAELGTELWLPSGTYTLTGHELFATVTSGSFRGMISGILYDIVP